MQLYSVLRFVALILKQKKTILFATMGISLYIRGISDMLAIMCNNYVVKHVKQIRRILPDTLHNGTSKLSRQTILDIALVNTTARFLSWIVYFCN